MAVFLHLTACIVSPPDSGRLHRVEALRIGVGADSSTISPPRRTLGLVHGFGALVLHFTAILQRDDSEPNV
jgi:hypothetical protein